MTISGIAIGIAAIVFLVSLGYGLQSLSIKKIASIEAIKTLDVTAGMDNVHKVDNQLIDQLMKEPEVDKISPLLALGIKPEYQDKKTDAVGNFVDDYYFSLEGIHPVVGAFFSNSKTDIVVSSALLKAMDMKIEEAVGKEIKSSVVIVDPGTKAKKELNLTFKIIGVVQDDSTSFSYLPIAIVSSEINPNQSYNSIKVKTKEQSQIMPLKEKITSMGYSVSSIADTISQIDQIFRIIQIILAFFGLIALLVASIGMFNTMTIALLERTRDIGIMKALGVRNRDVSRIFLSESGIIATCGGLLGLSIGWLTAKGINLAINLLAKSVGGEPQSLFSLPPVLGLIIVFFSILVGLATGFYPSKRASKLDPLDALRYE